MHTEEFSQSGTACGMLGRAKAFVVIRGEEGRTGRGTHSTADNQGAFACALADASSATLEAA